MEDSPLKLNVHTKAKAIVVHKLVPVPLQGKLEVKEHGNKFERISSNFNFEWTKFDFPKNRNKFESLCSNFELTAVSIKRASDISRFHSLSRGSLGPLMFPSC